MLHPLPDSISRMRVAIRRKRDQVVVLNSNLVKEFLLKLLQLGLINSFNVLDIKKLCVLLKYMLGDSVISNLTNFHRSSNPLYLKLFYIHSTILKSTISAFSSFIFSTSFGILTDAECRILGAGGFLIAAVT